MLKYSNPIDKWKQSLVTKTTLTTLLLNYHLSCYFCLSVVFMLGARSKNKERLKQRDPISNFL